MLFFKTVPDKSRNSRRNLQVNFTGNSPLVFPIDFYQLLAKPRKADINDEEEDGVYLYDVNRFLMSLNPEDQRDLYSFYYTIQKISENTHTALDVIKAMIHHTFRQLKVFDKLVEFAKSDLFRYPDLSEAGLKEGHCEEKTFRKKEFIELTALVIFSKTLIPVIGLADSLVQKETSKLDRVLILNEIIEPYLIDSGFDNVHHKLENFISDSTERFFMDHKESYLKVYRPELRDKTVDEDDIILFILGKVVTHSFYKYDGVYLPGDDVIPNIMIYISTVVKNLQKELSNKSKSVKKK